jgi:hypothetical protein
MRQIKVAVLYGNLIHFAFFAERVAVLNVFRIILTQFCSGKLYPSRRTHCNSIATSIPQKGVEFDTFKSRNGEIGDKNGIEEKDRQEESFNTAESSS